MNTITQIQSNFSSLFVSLAEKLGASQSNQLQKIVGEFSGQLQNFSAQLQLAVQQPIDRTPPIDVSRDVLSGSVSTNTEPSGDVPATVSHLVSSSRTSTDALRASPVVLAPGETGAGLPANYLRSPLYAQWLSQKPEMTSTVAEYGRALTQWQESNPFFVNPKNYSDYDAYLNAVGNSTESGNTAAMGDPYRNQSFLQSYYGSAASVNPWAHLASAPTNDEIAQWPSAVQDLYQRTQLAAASRAQTS